MNFIGCKVAVGRVTNQVFTFMCQSFIHWRATWKGAASYLSDVLETPGVEEGAQYTALRCSGVGGECGDVVGGASGYSGATV